MKYEYIYHYSCGCNQNNTITRGWQDKEETKDKLTAKYYDMVCDYCNKKIKINKIIKKDKDIKIIKETTL